MERDELERWLCGPGTLPPHPAAVANALGLAASDLADTTFLRAVDRVRSLRLTLAVLHDAFPADVDVWRWLEMPRCELGGETARQALMATPEAVECLAVQTWNEVAALANTR
jgi:hypothetical protein